MMRIRLSVVHISLAALVLCISSGAVLAQEDRPEREQERERVRERIEMVRAWKMTDVLDLSKEQGEELLSRLSKIDDRRRNLFEERGRIMHEMKDIIRDESPDEMALKDLLARLELVRDGLEEIDEEELGTVKGVLSTVQQARYVVFKENFERELRRIIRDVREKPRPRDVRNDRRPRGEDHPADSER